MPDEFQDSRCNKSNLKKNSNHKLIELELAESEARYKSLFEYNPDAVYSFDPTGCFTSANNVSVKLSGYRREDLLKMNYESIIAPEYLDQTREHFRKALAGEPQNYECCIVRRDGRLLFICVTNVPIIINKEIIGVYGVAKDISDKKQTERELIQAEKKYRGIVENILDVYYRSDKDGRLIMISPSGLSLLGYESETDAVGKDIAQTFFIDPRDGKNFLSVLNAKGFVKDYEIILKHRNGTMIPVSTSSRFYRDDRGNILGIEGIFRDIRERRQAEKALKESNEKYKQLFEMISDALFLIDNETGKILEVNASASSLYGFTYEELLKLRHTDLSAEPEKTRKVTLAGETFVPVRWHRKKDGTVFPVEIGARHIVWEGRMAHIAAIRDITDRLRFAKAERENFAKLRKALGATVKAIAITVETRDPYTAGHQRRVADLARSIATELKLSRYQIDGIRMASQIHDIGKISVPSEILSKPSKLTDTEFALIKCHPQAGYDILKDIKFPWPVARIVLEHHEHLDGSGYPNKLTGKNLLMESKILTVADVVEALSSHRPYRPSMGIEAALDEILKKSGVVYDPDAVNACVKLFREKGYKLKELK
jgi:PAS domain S-box-containing protein